MTERVQKCLKEELVSRNNDLVVGPTEEEHKNLIQYLSETMALGLSSGNVMVAYSITVKNDA